MRKKYTADEKAKIALEALKEIMTYAEITKKYQIHSSQINKWKKQLKEGISDIFSDRKEHESREKEDLIEELYQQIGKLTTENSWLKKKSELFKN
jgi:transposase-like protein